ncbi:GNAT family N-acetyltransferase [Paenibacillus sp. L3-i20]|uniref:GNAT family N-acetyltransferase n=1 Tax=Paenibacillus sp. L3-i20 TaxID=2905833 RepID=UPI001EDED66E|nr:GNAT family N-acetyltransferase [Paenibacillus sp. L3-i20]GKU79184.1 hypothetical protein L3i20_v235810 [Paenibacillus sp. L3-i20]
MCGLSHRALANRDLETICTFPLNAQELFAFGPKFVFPLTPEQIQLRLEKRFSPTVIVKDNDKPIAYANLYDINKIELSCYLGNVILSSPYRGQGISQYLLKIMMAKALEEHKLKKMKLFCHNTNTKALIFYSKNEFIPCGSKLMINQEGQKIVSIEMERELSILQ